MSVRVHDFFILILSCSVPSAAGVQLNDPQCVGVAGIDDLRICPKGMFTDLSEKSRVFCAFTHPAFDVLTITFFNKRFRNGIFCSQKVSG